MTKRKYDLTKCNYGWSVVLFIGRHARDTERAAIVAWLRHVEQRRVHAGILADAIDRGDHLRGEMK